MSQPRKPARVLRTAEATANSRSCSHPWNPSSEMDFPRQGKRAVRLGDRATVYALDGGAPFPSPGLEPI